MERGTYPTLWQLKWKEVLTPSVWQWNGKSVLNPSYVSWNGNMLLTPPCGSEVEIDTYPTMWQ